MPDGPCRENPSGGGSLAAGLRWLDPQSPLRECASLAASASAEIPRRSAYRNDHTGSEGSRNEGGRNGDLQRRGRRSAVSAAGQPRIPKLPGAFSESNCICQKRRCDTCNYMDEVFADRTKGPYADPVSPISYTQRCPALAKAIDDATRETR